MYSFRVDNINSNVVEFLKILAKFSMLWIFKNQNFNNRTKFQHSWCCFCYIWSTIVISTGSVVLSKMETLSSSYQNMAVTYEDKSEKNNIHTLKKDCHKYTKYIHMYRGWNCFNKTRKKRAILFTKTWTLVMWHFSYSGFVHLWHFSSIYINWIYCRLSRLHPLSSAQTHRVNQIENE